MGLPCNHMIEKWMLQGLSLILKVDIDSHWCYEALTYSHHSEWMRNILGENHFLHVTDPPTIRPQERSSEASSFTWQKLDHLCSTHHDLSDFEWVEAAVRVMKAKEAAQHHIKLKWQKMKDWQLAAEEKVKKQQKQKALVIKWEGFSEEESDETSLSANELQEFILMTFMSADFSQSKSLSANES